MSQSELETVIAKIVEKRKIRRAAVACYDFKTGAQFGHHDSEFFHAASTIKLAILFAVFKAADEKKLRIDDSLHVRNRFISVADGSPYRLQRGRDSDEKVHDRIGRTMRIEQLAHLMITVSSNLATNLLLDYLGVDYARKVLADAGINGVKLMRGVEDHVAHEKGINNEVTAAGLVQLCRVIQEAKLISTASRETMIDILLDQKFNAMIPSRLPSGTRVAHKTGEVSTVCHDAGLVFLPDREPYAVALLTEVDPDASERYAPVAEMSEAVFKHLIQS